MSQVTEVNSRCPVSKRASAEDRAGHGFISDVSGEVQDKGVCLYGGRLPGDEDGGPR